MSFIERAKPHAHDTSPIEVTILTIGLEQEVSDLILLSAKECGWKLYSRTFTYHISPRRRPHLPARLLDVTSVVVFVDFDRDPTAAADSVHYLRRILGTRLMAVSVSSQSSNVLTGMRAGCKDFLQTPLEKDDCEAVYRRLDTCLNIFTEGSSAEGSVLAMVGAKGGVGTTTIAVHLAAYLSQECNMRVLLVDNQYQFGHVCIYLGIDGALFHFQEVVRNVYRLDSELLKGFVAKHATGVDVLSSPDVGESARVMQPEDVRETLEFLRTQYDFIVVDCAGRLDDVSRAVIESAEQVYLIATPEISALRDLSRYVDQLTKNEDRSEIKVVINRYSSQFAVSLAEIEKAIRMPVSFSVPNSYIELVRSANLGTPLDASLKNGFTTELCNWAQSLVGESTQDPPRHGGLKNYRRASTFGEIWTSITNTYSRLRKVPGGLNA